MTPVQFEQALDRVLRGDQGAAQALIDHNKAVTRTARLELWEQVNKRMLAQGMLDNPPCINMETIFEFRNWCSAQATKETQPCPM